MSLIDLVSCPPTDSGLVRVGLVLQQPQIRLSGAEGQSTVLTVIDSGNCLELEFTTPEALADFKQQIAALALEPRLEGV